MTPLKWRIFNDELVYDFEKKIEFSIKLKY